jgi:hypothetical protein
LSWFCQPAPSYAQYIEPPQRNVQIISQTRNVTNIVTNNNVINNFGPPVLTIATKTNQNIQQVKLAIKLRLKDFLRICWLQDPRRLRAPQTHNGTKRLEFQCPSQ